MRKEINSIVRAYAVANGGCFEASWNTLYRAYNKALHQNVKSRATKRKCRPLDVVDTENNLEILKGLAVKIFGLVA